MLWIRSALFTVAGPGTVLVGVPLWLSTRSGGRVNHGHARWIGVPLVVVGVAGLLWCIWDFGRVGQGTLAPVDAPRFVVRGGLYRLVRNPMYFCVLTVLLGETLLFQSPRLIGWATIMATAFHLFVLTYEEPTLRRRFGSDYEAYCSTVPRWLPRRP